MEGEVGDQNRYFSCGARRVVLYDPSMPGITETTMSVVSTTTICT